MSNLNNKYVSLETLLNDLYCLFEFDSPIYTDELGYKWYRLETVLTVLNIDEDEYINGVYLMIIEDEAFISEEGINVLVIEYDNEYRENVLDLLASEVMPDIKSDALYIGNHLVNSFRTASINFLVFNDDNTDDIMTMNKVKKYTEKKINRKIKNTERKKNRN